MYRPPLSKALSLFVAILPLLAENPEEVEFFEKKVRPIFAEKCQVCHNPDLKTAGLDLSEGEGFLRGGQSGPIVSKDNPAQSLLLKVTSYEEQLKMPPTGKLEEAEIAALTEWVRMGAPWPGSQPVRETRGQGDPQEFTEQEKNFWAFQPVSDPEPPDVQNKNWVSSPIDRFILARLEEENLPPAPPASKTTLLRRATYDLTGLPPTENEIEEFLADDSPGAFAKVVDRLLASPRYGERWGRHWLDVARYADSTGNDEDHRYPYAWRYRDYVIDAFNSDMPYDQFVSEQVAGDLMPADRRGKINRRGIIATGFLALGAKAIAQQDKKRMLYDVYDEQLDVVSKAFLGLTVTCARCHDHKFDPILTKDYYSLIGIFASTRSFKDPKSHVSKLLFIPLVEKEQYKRYLEHEESIRNKKLEIDDVIDQQAASYISQLSPRLDDYMLAADQIADEGAAVAEVAQAHSLDAEILAKWVAYLKPRGVRRPHLDEWRESSGQERVEAARAYQQRFQERLAGWTEKLEKWRAKVRRMLKEMNMPPPPRPKFQPGKDRFFHEVYFAKEGPFALSEEEQEKVFSDESKQRLSELRAELKHLEDSKPPEPDMACAVEEGEIANQRVFIRGDYSNPGEDAPKRFPLILAGRNQEPIVEGSGRLQLAEWLTQRDNPLTARVMANRVWQWHFGEGIVRTPNNFGKMGERPTHPELLDYLARRFIENGWSVKKLHRLIMLSNAYQMSSETTLAKHEADPENRLLSRFNRRRLDVEEIRDGLLALDASLNFQMGGTLQSGFGTDKENSNKRLSLDPAAVERRSVYLPLRRANLPTLLNLFDFGDATTSMGKRPSTNIAPQALFMMNSEFVAERARNLAVNLVDSTEAEGSRMERAYLITLNRRPDAQEVDRGLSYIARFKRKFSDSISDIDAWQSFCRILMASNDFIYVD